MNKKGLEINESLFEALAPKGSDHYKILQTCHKNGQIKEAYVVGGVVSIILELPLGTKTRQYGCYCE